MACFGLISALAYRLDSAALKNALWRLRHNTGKMRQRSGLMQLLEYPDEKASAFWKIVSTMIRIVRLFQQNGCLSAVDVLRLTARDIAQALIAVKAPQDTRKQPLRKRNGGMVLASAELGGVWRA